MAEPRLRVAVLVRWQNRVLADALAHATGGEVELEPLADELEAQAHAVSAARARARGGRF